MAETETERLYCIFAKPIRRHDCSHHSYADDTQVYLVIKPLDNWKNVSRRLETCLSDVCVLMSSNMLKLNQDKTELIVLAPKHRVKEFSECCLSFDGTIVINASFVKKTSACFSTGHYACKNKQVQLQSHATFKFAKSDVIDRTPQEMRARH